MKVLNINSYYFSSTLYKPMEESLIRKHVDLTTYVPIYPGYKIRDEINYKPPNHVNVSTCFNKQDRFIFHYKQFKIFNDFSKKYNIKQYDLLHAHTLFTNGFIAYLAYKRYKTPYIVAIRNTDMNVFFKKMIHLRGLGVKILRNAKKIIFLSEPYLNLCINNYIPDKDKDLILNKSVVIPNGIDNFWFKNRLQKIERNTDNILKIIFVGNGSKSKNLISLIKAVEILLPSQKDKIKLTVVGNVSDDMLLKEFKTKKYIDYKGFKTKKELLLLYRKHDLFVLPSLAETFGLVYAEAMSQGLPVLYTKNQGFDGQFKDGMVGYAIDANDPADIAKKIMNAFNEHAEISLRCLELVDKFKWDNIIDDYMTIYQDIKC